MWRFKPDGPAQAKKVIGDIIRMACYDTGFGWNSAFLLVTLLAWKAKEGLITNWKMDRVSFHQDPENSLTKLFSMNSRTMKRGKIFWYLVSVV